jgi:hypothetical protein
MADHPNPPADPRVEQYKNAHLVAYLAGLYGRVVPPGGYRGAEAGTQEAGAFVAAHRAGQVHPEIADILPKMLGPRFAAELAADAAEDEEGEDDDDEEDDEEDDEDDDDEEDDEAQPAAAAAAVPHDEMSVDEAQGPMH